MAGPRESGGPAAAVDDAQEPSAMKQAIRSYPDRTLARRRLAMLAVTGPLAVGAGLCPVTGADVTSGPAPGGAGPTVSKTAMAAIIRLSPASATDPVGGTGTLTARVTTASGAPVPGALVVFTVTGANPAAGAATTGPAGTATFSDQGRVSGVDAITACQDVNANQACDSGEPAAIALRIWAPVVPAVPVTG
jgi:hypothetical protein